MGLMDLIRAGDRVTITNRFHQHRTGRAVMPCIAGGWVLDMGGKHGVPGIANDENVVRVTKARRRRAAAALVVLVLAFVAGCGFPAPASYTVNYQCLMQPTGDVVQTVTVVATSRLTAMAAAEQPVQLACRSTFDLDYRFGAVTRGAEQKVGN